MRNTQTKLNVIFFSTITAVAIWVASPTVKADPLLKPYQATYHMSWYGLYSGQSLQSLKKTAENTYQLTSHNDPKLQFLPFRYHETSTFQWELGQSKPQHYHYDIQEGKRHKKGTVTFDWHQKTLRPSQLPIQNNLQDKLSQTIDLRRALQKNQTEITIPVAEADKIRDYHYKVTGRERVKTKLGTVDTLKVTHVSRKGYITTTWFAPEYDYLPVKMTQERNGKIALRGELVSLSR